MKRIIYALAIIIIAFTTCNCAMADYEGVGIYLSDYKEDAYPVIVKVALNSPAYMARIDVGSRLIAIDGQDTSQMTVNDIISRLRGYRGTRVGVLIEENGLNREYNLERDIINDGSTIVNNGNSFNFMPYNNYYRSYNLPYNRPYHRPYKYRPISNQLELKTSNAG